MSGKLVDMSGRRILLVEDIFHVAEALRETLVVMGHETDVVSSGEQALRAYEPGKYDLVICDHAMPGMSGIELTQVIRALCPRQLVLLMTNPVQSASTLHGGLSQADYMLPKPFSVKEFETALASLLSSDRLA